MYIYNIQIITYKYIYIIYIYGGNHTESHGMSLAPLGCHWCHWHLPCDGTRTCRRHCWAGNVAKLNNLAGSDRSCVQWLDQLDLGFSENSVLSKSNGLSSFSPGWRHFQTHLSGCGSRACAHVIYIPKYRQKSSKVGMCTATHLDQKPIARLIFDIQLILSGNLPWLRKMTHWWFTY